MMLTLQENARPIDCVLLNNELRKNTEYDHIYEGFIYTISSESPRVDFFEDYVEELMSCRDLEKNELNLAKVKNK